MKQPPIADRIPFKHTQFGEDRIDDYHWMRADNWQDVMRDPEALPQKIKDHLLAENAYFEEQTSELRAFESELFQEMKARIKEEDQSIPMRDGPWLYYSKFVKGGEYKIFLRKPTDGGNEQVLFDGNKESKGHDYFNVPYISHSPDHSLIAYGIDTKGSEYFDIRIRKAGTEEMLDDVVPSTDGDAVWANDSKSFYYIERDDNQRPKRVKHHVLGQAPHEDQVIYEEEDDGFFLSVDTSQSEEYLFVISSNGDSTEIRFRRLDDVEAPLKLIKPRKANERYYVEHNGDYFYIHTNCNGAYNFKVMRTHLDKPEKENWQEWIPHREDIDLSSIICFKNFLIILERENALPRIIVSDYDLNQSPLSFDEDVYSLGLFGGYEYDTEEFIYSFESPKTPSHIYRRNIKTGEEELLKTQEVPSGHNPGDYLAERLFIEARDGEEIPVTILRHKDTQKDGSSPLFLYGYGSYGLSMPASFNTQNFSLVNRGVIYAIAHIRGGADKGRKWYLDGKMEKKMVTFTDFSDVAKGLTDQGYGRLGQIVSCGRSAGGLLMGAIVNLNPDYYAAIIAGVPFVDVLNTISDETLPLTPPEWVEWGNPIKDKDAYTLIKSYSPYDNIKQGTQYPAILATGGVSDYRVTYWEPAKWIARLRAEVNGGPFYLRMNMGAGHFGSAARFERLKDYANEFAFALKIYSDMDNVAVKDAF